VTNATSKASAVPYIAAWAIAALLWGAAARNIAVAEDKPAQSGPSLDDELLKDLDNELLEGAGSAKDKPKPAKGKAGGAKPAEPGEPETIDDTMPAEDPDPLVRVSEAMRTAEELIPQTARRAHAKALQDRVIDDLSRLIEQAESQRSQQKSKGSQSKQQQQTKERQQVKQAQQSKGNSGKDSNKPAEDSSNQLNNAQAARPDPEAFRALLKDTWGHLPARDREQVLQNSPDKFLPQYELMIERYYKRLAEGQRSN
jgi:hypothetical protein